jgi:hypothetical protein
MGTFQEFLCSKILPIYWHLDSFGHFANVEIVPFCGNGNKLICELEAIAIQNEYFWF